MDVSQPADGPEREGSDPPHDKRAAGWRSQCEFNGWTGMRVLLTAVTALAAMSNHGSLAAGLAVLVEIGEMIWGPAKIR
jgi:hypothetical protein